MIKQLIYMPFLKLKKIEYSDSTIRICATIKSRRSKFPVCGKYSKRVLDYYIRTISDLPVFRIELFSFFFVIKLSVNKSPDESDVFTETTSMKPKTLASTTELINDRCPKMVDPETRRDSVILSLEGLLSYYYTQPNKYKSGIHGGYQ
jgi:hypothetical protein